MGTRTVSTKVKLEGLSELKASIDENYAAIGMINAEMKSLDLTIKSGEESVANYIKRGELLEQRLLTQKDSGEKLKEIWEQTVAVYGEASEEASKAAKKYYDNEAAIKRTEQAVKNNNEAMEKAAAAEKKAAGGLEGFAAKVKSAFTETKGLGDVLNDAAGKFGIDLPQGAASALNSLGSFSAAEAAAAAGSAALVAAIAKVEKQLISMTKEAASAADEVLTLSLQTGMTTRQIQEFQYASELIDVSLDTLTGSLTKLTNNMESARDGSESTQAVFDKLGVSVTNADGSLRDANTVFYEAIDALGEIENSTERDALAMDIFGKSAQDLNPLIIAGSDALEEFAQEAQDVGAVLTDDQLEALGGVDDAYQRFGNTLDATKKQLSAEFAPYLSESLKDLTGFIGNLGASFKESGIVSSFGMLLESLSGIIGPSDELANNQIPALVSALRPLAMIVAAIADAADLISGLLNLDFSKVGKALGFGYSYGNGNNIQTLREQWQQSDINAATEASGYGQYYANGQWYGSYDQYLQTQYNTSGYSGTFEAWKNAQGYNAAGDNNWRGGLTWVGENGPEVLNLPKGTQIYSAQESREMAGGDTFNFYVDIRSISDLQDLITMAKNQRRIARMYG